MFSLEIGPDAVARLNMVYASTAIDTKASPLAMDRGLKFAVQASEAVLFFEDPLDVTEQCTGIAIAEVLMAESRNWTRNRSKCIRR